MEGLLISGPPGGGAGRGQRRISSLSISVAQTCPELSETCCGSARPSPAPLATRRLPLPHSLFPTPRGPAFSPELRGRRMLRAPGGGSRQGAALPTARTMLALALLAFGALRAGSGSCEYLPQTVPYPRHSHSHSPAPGGAGGCSGPGWSPAFSPPSPSRPAAPGWPGNKGRGPREPPLGPGTGGREEEEAPAQGEAGWAGP